MSVIKLSKAAYFHNLEQISKKLGSKDKIFAVLKDNAYGHGDTLIAALAKEFGIKKAVVRTLNEAKKIESFFDEILILSHLPNGKEDENPKFIYAINDISAFDSLKCGIKAHLALDTLMHRHGINSDDLQNAFIKAKERKIYICGAYTHFCCADELSGSFSLQYQKFCDLKARFSEFSKTYAMPSPLFHSHNSAATERNKNLASIDESVRIGIAQYGYAQFDNSLDLKPVLSLWAHKISARVLKAGECVGYGGVFMANDDMCISTYDLGYSDGLLRYDGQKEFVFSKECEKMGAKMLGRMSMDSFSANSDKNELCVIDDANIWAEFFGTINYDILVKLAPNIDRIVI